MDIRILRYFLTVAKEQNFTKAAEQLNITQPTLSRQLSALEDEIGKALFIRGNRSVTLTETGVLLKRRALEILDLEEKMMNELLEKEELIEGTITIGCGEFAAVERLAEICKIYKQKYPMVQISLHTATADSVYDMMKKSFVDIGLFLEPVDTEGVGLYHGLQTVIIGVLECGRMIRWLEKEFYKKRRPYRKTIDSARKNEMFKVNLPTGLGKTFQNYRLLLRVILERMPELWRQMDWGIQFQSKVLQSIGERTLLVHRRLYPEIAASTVIAWRRNIPYSLAMNKFIDEINAFKA